MLARGALTAIDSNSNLNRNQVHLVATNYRILRIRKFQAKGEKGSLRYDLVSNRAGTKWLVLLVCLYLLFILTLRFVRPRMERKDDSWREAIAQLVLQVLTR